jgi:sarcosine oxidase
MYTVTPDAGFVIDTHPSYPNIILASPYLGHGFKHSAAIGETLAELAVEEQTGLILARSSSADLNSR